MTKDEILLTQLWKEYNAGRSVSTAIHYDGAMKRFVKDMGAGIRLNDVTRDNILVWRNKMLEVLTKTTTNIYLRSLAAVLHYAYDNKLIRENPKFLFAGLKMYGKRSSQSRKYWYVPIEDMIKLWNFYENRGKGNIVYENWRSDYKRKYLEAAGLFLFMYLANGMNLRDACLLRYDKYYFHKGRREMQFVRHKTASRTGQDAIFPILPELRIILDRQGCKEEEGGLVFPYFKEIKNNEEDEIKVTSLLNHVIRKRMRSVSKAMGFPYVPTSTWARHSFATNLIQSGVSKEYVSWAMAHADCGVTSTYIASYGFKQMWRNNSLLLHPKADRSEILDKINLLGKEQLVEVVRLIIEGVD